MAFPNERLRRLRRLPLVRAMVRETHLRPTDLVQPIFLVEGDNKKEPVPSMPGVYRHSLDRIGEELEAVQQHGIPAVILFGVPRSIDPRGEGAHSASGVVPRTLRWIKEQMPGLTLIADVCLCAYTEHGHCGLVLDREVANDPSLEVLARTAVTYAQTGADIVAPSDMMDGRVQAIRRALDAEGLERIPLLSYAAKFASAFYGPFREAAHSAPQFGDRATYQLDPANAREALREMALDAEEGADILMVKPAGPYLDLLRQARERFDHPLAAYQVSGEYAMLKAAVEQGWLDEERAVLESLVAVKRAGADLILTYYAQTAARALRAGA